MDTTEEDIDFDEEEDDVPTCYCKNCGGCGEVGCDGIKDFLNKHVKGKTDCMYEESYIEDILTTYSIVEERIDKDIEKLILE